MWTNQTMTKRVVPIFCQESGVSQQGVSSFHVIVRDVCDFPLLFYYEPFRKVGSETVCQCISVTVNTWKGTGAGWGLGYAQPSPYGCGLRANRPSPRLYSVLSSPCQGLSLGYWPQPTLAPRRTYFVPNWHRHMLTFPGIRCMNMPPKIHRGHRHACLLFVRSPDRCFAGRGGQNCLLKMFFFWLCMNTLQCIHCIIL